MSTEITLCKLSAKYLTDWLNKPGWGTGLDDIYLAGELLADVLPHFGSGAGELQPPEQPRCMILTKEGAPDWSRMTKIEAAAYQEGLAAWTAAYAKWAREMVTEDGKPTSPPKKMVLTDKQLVCCQKMLQYFAPRSAEEKAKAKEKNEDPREEMRADEYTFRLLKSLKLSPTS